jgi:hypothetical protein
MLARPARDGDPLGTMAWIGRFSRPTGPGAATTSVQQGLTFDDDRMLVPYDTMPPHARRSIAGQTACKTDADRQPHEQFREANPAGWRRKPTRRRSS